MSLAGELNDLGLSDIFQILALSRRTGTLTVTSPNIVGQALFSSGQVVAGGLSPYPTTVAKQLQSLGLVAPQQLQALVVLERQDVRGAELLQRINTPMCPIMQALEQLLRQMMAALLGIAEGTFHFDNADDVDPYAQLSIEGTWALCPKGLQAQYLAMEALRVRDEAPRGAPKGASPTAEKSHDDWSDLLTAQDAPDALDKEAKAQDLTHLRDVVLQLRRLPQGRTPGPLLLRALQLHCERGAYFELTGGQLVGRVGFGHSASGRPVEATVSGARVGVRAGSALEQLLQAGAPELGPLPEEEGPRALVQALGGGGAESVLMAPWRSGGRVVGLLVGDNPSGVPLTDAPGIDIIIGAGQPAALRSQS